MDDLKYPEMEGYLLTAVVEKTLDEFRLNVENRLVYSTKALVKKR